MTNSEITLLTIKAKAVMNSPEMMKIIKAEAMEKTAHDIRKKNGGGTTAKAVELMMMRNEEVAERVKTYISVGISAVTTAVFLSKLD